MKNTKRARRAAAFAAAVVMAACAAIPMSSSFSASAAATPGHITFSDATEGAAHTYTVYKIFSGTYDAQGKTLTGINWANPSKGAAFLSELKKDATLSGDFTNCNNPAEVATVLGGYENNSTKAQAFAKFAISQKSNLVQVNSTASNDIEVSEDGYYVIEETELGNNTDEGAMTSYLLGLYSKADGAEIKVKSSIPSVEKKIQENVKTGNWENADKYGDRYNDTADFCIGDTVPFKLIGTLPSTLSSYDTYKYVFHDTLGKEFTVAGGQLDSFAVTEVKIGGTAISSGYTVKAETGEGDVTNITVTFDDIKKVIADNNISVNSNTTVEVTYNAVLNQSAAIGKPGQKNEVYLEYSNNPNNGGDGTSKTPVDKVIAFTYELDVTKVDGVNNETKLKDAKFALYRMVGENKQYAVLSPDFKVEKWLTMDATFGTDGEATNEGDKPTVVSSDADGQFKFIGLDDGIYYLEETKAPTGYNKLTDPVKVTITADTSNAQDDNTINGDELVTLTIKTGDNGADVNGDLDKGSVAATIENNSGSSLPSTGGIGTTMFYVGGGVLVAGAGVILITKKRAKKDAE